MREGIGSSQMGPLYLTTAHAFKGNVSSGTEGYGSHLDEVLEEGKEVGLSLHTNWKGSFITATLI